MGTEKYVWVKKNVYTWVRFFIGRSNSIRVEERSGRSGGLSMLRIPEMVNMLIFTDRRFTIKDIFEKLWISVRIAHKIVYDDSAFYKVSCCWVSPELCRARAMEILCQFGWEQLPYPPYSLFQSPSMNFCVEQSFKAMKWSAPGANS